jgi:hypothetical protein
MSDNIIKFRQPEKKPEPKEREPLAPLPGWVPFVALLVLALGIYAVQQVG